MHLTCRLTLSVVFLANNMACIRLATFANAANERFMHCWLRLKQLASLQSRQAPENRFSLLCWLFCVFWLPYFFFGALSFSTERVPARRSSSVSNTSSSMKYTATSLASPGYNKAYRSFVCAGDVCASKQSNVQRLRICVYVCVCYVLDECGNDTVFYLCVRGAGSRSSVLSADEKRACNKIFYSVFIANAK